MGEKKPVSWITPFTKQCFVVLGVSLAVGQMGLVVGFSSGLVPQLRLKNSSIPIDDNSGSWLASLPAIAIMIGNMLVPLIIDRFGRKFSYYTALVLNIIGWIGVIVSNNLPLLMSARLLQGIAIGTVAILGPFLIGEYSSPVNRGAFLMTIAIFIGIGVFAVHTMVSYLTWRLTAIICTAVTVLNLVLAFFSPESPSWLADQGRYDECKKSFRWLRGDDEEAELEKMIEASVIKRKEMEEKNASQESFMTRFTGDIKVIGQTLKKNEFYKPFIIMIHIYAMAQWSGVNLLASYALDFINTVVGNDVNMPVMIISLDLQRIVSTTIALAIIKKMRRRRMIIASVGLNVVIMFTIAAFTYFKEKGLLPFDSSYNWYIGIGLIHILTFSIAVGALPMSFILAGEIFPLQYKSMGGGFSCLFMSINFFLSVKTVPFLLNSIQVYGLYAVYGCFLIYFMAVVLTMLPETKDRTLQDIEEEFRGLKKPVETTGQFTKTSGV